MGLKVERFSVFYLEVDEENKRVVFCVDERNLKLMPSDRLQATYRQATTRLLHYSKAGYEVNKAQLQSIQEIIRRIIYDQ